jgi:hypothetical protein
MGATAVPSAGGWPIIPTSHGEAGGRLAGVLYVARQDDTEHHHGGVFRVHESVFAPPDDLLAFVRPGASDAAIFRTAYLEHLRGLWQRDPQAFLGLIELARGGGDGIARSSGLADLTLVDDWGDVDYALRRILAAVLKQIATRRRDAARRAQRRRGAVPPHP